MDETADLRGHPALTRPTRPAHIAKAVLRSGSGWRAAFAVTFDAQFAPLHRYLNRLCGDPDLASELAQDAFVRLYERGELPDDARAWLFTVATNLFRNAMSKRARRLFLLTENRSRNVLSDPVAAPSTQSEAAEARQGVRDALTSLSDRDRALLLLRSEGYSYREIASQLGLRATNVGTMLRRARATFKRTFEEASHGS